MNELESIFSGLKKQNILLAYTGKVSPDLLNCIMDLAENKLSKLEYKSMLRKRVFNVLVELIQNLFHHCEDHCSREADNRNVIVLICKEGSSYHVITRNTVDGESLNKIKSTIDCLNSMSPEEIVSVYRERLEKGHLTEKGGAGLGLLDIIRRSRDKIIYSIEQIGNAYFFLSLQVKISA